MFWADRIAQEIIASGKYKPYWVDDMKTPSGRIHVGSLRGVVTHDLIHHALRDAGQQVTFTYVFDDHDPMDGLPIYLPKEKWSKYLGQPLFTIPSPEKEGKSYAEHFANEFIGVFNKIGCHPKILWASELYKQGKMNEGVKKCLDNAQSIRNIYEELYHKKMASDWYPFVVVCPECGKESTTRVTAWDGKEVAFVCKVDAVPWTKGCGYEGKISPFSGGGKFVGKLSWKVEWPVKWSVIGITVEGAGKDHMSAGGSHDVAKLVCEGVLKYPLPYSFAHEFFLIGGKKMSSSKGLGSSAKEVSDIMPPYLLRFTFARIDYRQAIDFDPVETMAIPDLFDEYDRCWQAYNTEGDADLARAFEMAQIEKNPQKNPKLFIPRFREIANYIQLPNVDLREKLVSVKGSELTSEELLILNEREEYARKWLSEYAPVELKIQMSEELPKEVKSLSSEQKKYLQKAAELVQKISNAEELQTALYVLSKEMKLETKKAFAAIYISTLGKPHGPKAGWFLLQYPKEKVMSRFQEAVK